MMRLSTVAAGALGAILAVSSTGSPGWAQGKWECPAAEKAKPAPASTPQSVAAGKKLSADKACNACHGDGGKGDGPGATALNPKPADWTSRAVQEQTEGCVLWKITTGRGAMPPWSSIVEAERWQLVHYIKSLKKK